MYSGGHSSLPGPAPSNRPLYRDSQREPSAFRDYRETAQSYRESGTSGLHHSPYGLGTSSGVGYSTNQPGLSQSNYGGRPNPYSSEGAHPSSNPFPSQSPHHPLHHQSSYGGIGSSLSQQMIDRGIPSQPGMSHPHHSNYPETSGTQGKEQIYSSHMHNIGPAPSGGRSQSVGPSGHLQLSGIREGYSQARNKLTRQHRSMDMVGGLDGLGTENDIAPLSIATGYGQPTSSYGVHRSGPLSNPTASTQQYWSTVNNAYGDTDFGGGLSLQQEFEQLKQDYASNLETLNQTMNSIKTFWSPELKRERQMRREEANRIAQLERMLAAAGGSAQSVVGGNAALQMEISARDDRIRQLQTALDEYSNSALLNSGSEVRTRELEQTVAHMQEMLKQAHSGDASGRFALESALRRIDEKSQRIAQLEDEISRIRLTRAQQPRDFTDKSVTSHEMVTLRMKMERSELELSERKQELATAQTRLRNAEDECNDLKAHLQLIKDQSGQREQNNVLLHGDVEALRAKLEAKNQSIEQKDARIEKLEKDLMSSKNENADRLENVRQTELRMSQVMGRLDGLENTIREKDAELDRMKLRLNAHPDVQREKEFLAKLEQADREHQNLEQLVDQVRRNADSERQQQLETYQSEATQLKANIDNLQKELTDRDVLLESQNEKIGDMGRELASAEARLSAAMVDKGADELRKEVEGARNEVEKLLKMVRSLEKEKANVISQYKQLQGSMDGELNGRAEGRTGLQMTAPQAHAGYTKRIEELENALRESVSITAEREVHLSHQKQLLQQVNQQMMDAKREAGELKRRLGEIGGADREAMLRNMEAERRLHIEQLLQLKQEALMAAVAEKDAHLALLEKGRAPRDEIETVRRHKDALLTKLKQENERRAMMMRADSNQAINLIGTNMNMGSNLNLGPTSLGGPSIGIGAPILPLSSTSHPIHAHTHNAPTGMMGPPSHTKPPSRSGDPMVNSGDLDDQEGIWA